MTQTYWRGALLDERSAAMMDEVALLVPAGTVLRPTQGSYSGGVSASGGTHDGCGAIDLAGQDAGMTTAMRNAIRDAMRQVGWAAWVRTPAQSDWPYHIHGISVQPGGKGDRGCLSSGAHGQVADYYEGRNGLAAGAPDDGPRAWVGVTWETYQGDDDMTPEQAKQLSDVSGRLAQLDPVIRNTYNNSDWTKAKVGPMSTMLSNLDPVIRETYNTVKWLQTKIGALIEQINDTQAPPGPEMRE
jgi:hypothetical protein